MQYTINRPITIPVVIASSVTLQVFILIDGVLSTEVATQNPAVISLGASLFSANISFIPTAIGKYTVIVIDPSWSISHPNAASDVVKMEDFEVVTKTNQDLLKDIEDESLGSWSWDKNTGDLIVLRQNGSQLATFRVADTISVASRERVA